MNKVYTASLFNTEEVPGVTLIRVDLEGRPWHSKAHAVANLKAMAEAADLKAFLAGQDKKVVLEEVYGVDEPTEFSMLAGDVVVDGVQYYTIAGFAADGQLVLFTACDEEIEGCKNGEGSFGAVRFDADELESLLAQVRTL